MLASGRRTAGASHTTGVAWLDGDEGEVAKPYEAWGKWVKGLEDDVLGVGYGMTERILKASRAEIDRAFQRMNSRW